MIPPTYDRLIKCALEEYRPDGLLLDHVKAQMWQESRMVPTAVSHAGAVGLMQIMPNTAIRELLPAIGIPHAHDWQRFCLEPSYNVRMGIWYMRQLLAHFGTRCPAWSDRWSFALASYNAGYSRINRAMRAARWHYTPEHGDFRKWIDAGKPYGEWQQWAYVEGYVRLHVGSKEPVDYVRLIKEHYGTLN